MTDEMKTPKAATLRAVAPLIVVNALAVYGQLAYAMEHIAPDAWSTMFRVLLAIGFAAAVESVALYVGWHAHDALLLKSHATARSLRRWSFIIAAAVASMNYAHFAGPDFRPTAAACAFGLLSLLSPWMWGLHTRRAARLQLLKEHRADEAGAEFSSVRRRAFPVLTWQARRWSIMHNVADPIAAWDGFLAERNKVDAVDAPPVRVPSIPRQRALSARPVSGGPAIGWDVDKLVRMLQEDAPDADMVDACSVTKKTIQRTRRVVRAIASGDADTDIVRGDIKASFVARIRQSMEVK